MDNNNNNNHPTASRSVSIVGGGVSMSNSSNQQNEIQAENAIAEGSPMLNNDNNSPTAIPVEDGDNISSRAKGAAATEKLGVTAAASNDDDTDAVASTSPNVNNVTYDGGNNTEQEEEGEEANQNDNDGEEDDIADDESDYSYAYEDDESATFGGFLEPVENNNNFASLSNGGGGNEGVNLVAEDSAAAAGKKPADLPRTISRAASNLSTSSPPTVPETNPGDNERKQKWREPTRAAVNMSLRAEKEKTGGRRRLASDLYKIMMADTKEAGFSLEPADEDSMEKWCIKLFDFDEDSCLAKDLLVCNMDHVELEMSFPGKSTFVLFCIINSCVQSKLLVIWLLYLNFVCLRLIAFANHIY